jgi:hypothetical protein
VPRSKALAVNVGVKVGTMIAAGARKKGKRAGKSTAECRPFVGDYE